MGKGAAPEMGGVAEAMAAGGGGGKGMQDGVPELRPPTSRAGVALFIHTLAVTQCRAAQP